MAHAKTVHLYSNQCYDESEVWCKDPNYFAFLVEPVTNPQEADCLVCLDEAAAFGKQAARQRTHLNIKDETQAKDAWVNPYSRYPYAR